MEPKPVGSLLKLGYWPAVAGEYYAAGKYSRAVDLCLRMLEKEPDLVSGRIILGKSLYHAGRYQQARKQFLLILKFDAENLVALKYMGDILFREGEEAAAMAYYRRILEIDPLCSGLAYPIEKSQTVEIRQMTLRRPGETLKSRKFSPLREPAFVTESAGDIYREQGYFQLAREVYRRLLANREDRRIAEKLRETEEKLKKKEGINENTH